MWHAPVVGVAGCCCVFLDVDLLCFFLSTFLPVFCYWLFVCLFICFLLLLALLGVFFGLVEQIFSGRGLVIITGHVGHLIGVGKK